MVSVRLPFVCPSRQMATGCVLFVVHEARVLAVCRSMCERVPCSRRRHIPPHTCNVLDLLSSSCVALTGARLLSGCRRVR